MQHGARVPSLDQNFRITIRLRSGLAASILYTSCVCLAADDRRAAMAEGRRGRLQATASRRNRNYSCGLTFHFFMSKNRELLEMEFFLSLHIYLGSWQITSFGEKKLGTLGDALSRTTFGVSASTTAPSTPRRPRTSSPSRWYSSSWTSSLGLASSPSSICV